ncbi:MAG TPA: DUF397 domain-containing protein [Actinophytocola sp.]|uniref:DUF397 domain-containing protein n=1 Tax=Actinophytocola sp. TaxID=1872138 RepID=UPI002DDD0C68|nr:DUF397 domain-containing protein [Actinophytocola sp.]HEV2779595.1 DUF397 domain-containing protein [Actinophytocola sp.]
MEFGHSLWRKSSFSSTETACVEIAYPAEAATVGIRDSKDPSCDVLLASLPAWEAFWLSVRQ